MAVLSFNIDEVARAILAPSDFRFPHHNDDQANWNALHTHLQKQFPGLNRPQFISALNRSLEIMRAGHGGSTH